MLKLKIAANLDARHDFGLCVIRLKKKEDHYSGGA